MSAAEPRDVIYSMIFKVSRILLAYDFRTNLWLLWSLSIKQW